MPKISNKQELGLLNHTELVQIAKRIGILGVSKATARENVLWAIRKLEHVAVGEEPVPDPMDPTRHKVKSWFERYWEKLRMQAPEEHCPDCFASNDVQVANCWLDNKHQIT